MTHQVVPEVVLRLLMTTMMTMAIMTKMMVMAMKIEVLAQDCIASLVK